MKHTLSTSQDRTPAKVWLGAFAIGAVLLVLPFLLGATAGQGWIRILNFALLYVMLALGLNIVVGFAGLLDLGYIAFYAVGAYAWALLASPHFDLPLPFWIVLPIGVALAAFNPELITLGTTAYYAGDLMLKPLMHYLPRFTWSEFSDHCVISLSGLGLRIGELAGASVAFNTLYERGLWKP